MPRTASWVSTTPFGSPVVPLVATTSASPSSTGSSSRIAPSSRVDRCARKAGIDRQHRVAVVPGRRSASTKPGPPGRSIGDEAAHGDNIALIRRLGRRATADSNARERADRTSKIRPGADVEARGRQRVQRHPLRGGDAAGAWTACRSRSSRSAARRCATRSGPQTLIELADAFERAREDLSVGVIILTGEGDQAFCSGGDQRVRGDTGYLGEDEAAKQGVGRFHVTDLQVQMRRLPKPIIAMVAGYAIGGGHVLHVVCDLTIAADNARFGQTGPKVGSFDGGFGSSVLSRLVGPKKAKEIWFLCRQYDAQQALDMGLVNTVVPLEDLEVETVQWCREMLRLSPFALRLMKASFHADEDGLAGIQQLAARHQPALLRRPRRRRKAARRTRRSGRPDFSQFPRRPTVREQVGRRRAPAHAAGGDRAGARRHGVRGR